MLDVFTCVDANDWLGTAGPMKSVPVLAVISGHGNFSGRSDFEFTAFIEFQHFFEIEPSDYDFQVPAKDLFCVGRKAEVVKVVVNARKL